MKKRLKFPNKRELNRGELERYNRYAIDLFLVLKTLRKYKEGVTIFGSRRFGEDNTYYQKARELGGKLAKNGHTVITGGGPGIMEAANRGAHEAGGKAVGFSITIPTEQGVNPYLTDTAEFNYFFSRKLALAFSSKVWVFFPGGYGTLDELFDVLTLVRDGKVPPVPIFLIGSEYWKKLDSFFKSNAADAEEFDSSDFVHYKITDDLDEVVKAANQVIKPL